VTAASEGEEHVFPARRALVDCLTDPERLVDLFRRVLLGQELSYLEFGFLQGIIAAVEHPALAEAAMRNYATEPSFQPQWTLQPSAIARPDMKPKLAKYPRDHHAHEPKPVGRTENYGEVAGEGMFRSQSEGWADAQLVKLFGYVPSHKADLEFRRVLREEKRLAERERLESMDAAVSKLRQRGHTRKEIAKALDLTEAAVQRSFSRLRRSGALK
jgi:hypothetical protein